jgi:transposase
LDHGRQFWLSEAQWGALVPLLPKNQPGAPRRTDDRQVISGIVHVLKTGCRRQDCPAVYGPSTTVQQSLSPMACAAFFSNAVRFGHLEQSDPQETSSFRRHRLSSDLCDQRLRNRYWLR